MDSLFDKIAEAQNNGKKAIICTLIKCEGSAPRNTGAKMLVYADGSIVGTIGGGSLEHFTIKKALEIMPQSQLKIIDFSLAEVGMLCGGNVTILFEPIEPKALLYIFGAGHIGKYLAKLAAELQFSVCLIDDRSFERWDIPSGVQFINQPFSQALQTLSFNNNTFICVTTYSHDLDTYITGECAKKMHRYMGLMASKRKIEAIKTHLISNGVITKAEFSNIDTPIGIPIACETPEEIAISILAKLIDVRNTQEDFN